MRQSLISLLEKHFAWTAEFSISLNIANNIQTNLEIYLSEVDNLLHLEPLQVLNLITQKKLDSLISYLKSCYQICTNLNEMSETFYYIQFNVHLEVLLSCQFTHHQIESFDGRSYMTLEYIEQLTEKLQYCSIVYHLACQIYQYRLAIINNTNQLLIENHEVDEDIVEVLLELPEPP
jgi:hypothetical protein